MNALDELRTRAKALSKLPSPTKGDVERELGTTMRTTYETDGRIEHESADLPPPFTTGRLIDFGGGNATLELVVAGGQAIAQEELELSGYGEPTDIDVNTRIGPEGVITYEYVFGEANIAFEVTKSSKRLRRVFLIWNHAGARE